MSDFELVEYHLEDTEDLKDEEQMPIEIDMIDFIDEKDIYYSDDEDIMEVDMAGEALKSSHMKNDKLAIGGFMLELNKKVNDRCYWRCDQYYTLKCSATAISKTDLDGNYIILKHSSHNHHASIHRVLIEQTKAKIRDEASKDLHGTPSQIVDKILRSDLARDNQLVGMLSTEANLRQMSRRIQKKFEEFLYPPSPKTPDFDLDLNFEGLYLDGEPLCLVDIKISNDPNKRVQIFTSDTLLQAYCNAELTVYDGTFKTCTRPFFQLFIIHGNIPGYDRYFTFPMIWILLTGKETCLYSDALKAIKMYAESKGWNIRSKYAICDFEIAIRVSIKQDLPWIEPKACWFHTWQIIITRLRKMKLYKKYRTNSEFAKQIHLIAALAFFPPADIYTLFDQLYAFLPRDSLARKVCDWFQGEYIIKPDGRPARNPPSFWSVYELVMNDLPKTQCGAEQSHHSLFLACNKTQHLPYYRMLAVIRAQVIKSEQNIDRTMMGLKVKERVALNQQKQNEIFYLLQHKDDHDRHLFDVLRAIAVKLCKFSHTFADPNLNA